MIDKKGDYEDSLGLNPMQMGVSMFSPNKIMVESATMIFILAFMLFNIVILVYKGNEMSPVEAMLGLIGLFITFLLAGRQYASFR
tara:strand:+ start:142 stop:396 length:255 start_codon:yes stop_codon:yes gene_type:complete